MLRRAMLFLTLILVLACSTSVLAAQVTLTVAFGDELKPIVDEYAKSNPNVKIEFLAPYNDNFDQLATHVAGGIAADVMITYNETTARAIQNGLFLDLSPYIKRDTTMQATIKDFIPGTMEMATHNGGVYGFPYYSSSGALYLNMDMFNNAGMGIPTKTWNWDDFSAIAKKLTRRAGDGTISVYGFYQMPSWLFLWPWMWQAGAEGYAKGNPSVATLDSQEAIRGMQFLQDMVSNQTMTTDWRAYHDGKAAMYLGGGWDINYIDGGFSIGVAPTPKGPAGRATFTNTDILSISANTKHPEEAWNFVKWFYSRDTQQNLLNLLALQPARMSLGRNWVNTVLKANAKKSITGFEVFVEDAPIAKPQPFYTDVTVTSTILEPALQNILMKGAPVGPTLTEATRTANAALKKAK